MTELLNETFTKPLLRRCNNIESFDEIKQYFYSDCDKSLTAYESNNIQYCFDDETKFYTTSINGDRIKVFKYDNAYPFENYYKHFTLNNDYYTPKKHVISEGYEYFIIENDKKVKVGIYKGSFYTKFEQK
jgi:hypothetical protein